MRTLLWKVRNVISKLLGRENRQWSVIELSKSRGIETADQRPVTQYQVVLSDLIITNEAAGMRLFIGDEASGGDEAGSGDGAGGGNGAGGLDEAGLRLSGPFLKERLAII